MRNLRAEYPAWFEPDEVQILLAAFDKAWEGCSSQQHQIPGGQTRICAGDTRETNYCGRSGRRARPGPAARRRSTRLGSIKSVSGPASTGSWHATGGCFPLLEVGSAEPYTPFACYSHR